jgi:NAD(P)-dependent dehydrogenase (short-subunit alcohol dehydrogenase family)
MKGLQDKIVVVGGGIGAATVERLVEGGARVVVGDLDGAHAAELAARMRARGGRCTGMGFDIADEQSVRDLVEHAVREHGALDALHANAADLRTIHADSNVLEEPLEVFDQTIRVNLRGHWLCTRVALPWLLERGGGSLVYTSSGAAGMGEPVRPAYAVSKAGIEALMRHVASAWGKHNVRANAVAPGLVITPQLVDSIPAEFREMALRAARHVRLGEPADIASMVAFLVSDEAAWITGQVLGVNGGACF